MIEALNQSKSLALNYLASSVIETGYFNYSLDLITGQVSSKNYNLIRHAGSVFAILDNLDNNEEKLWQAGSKGLHKCLTYAVQIPDNEQCVAIVDKGLAKLGATALCLAALSKYLTARNHIVEFYRDLWKTACSMGNYLLSQQDEEGHFRSLYFLNGCYRPFESLYYPGEAILALTLLGNLTGIEKYIMGARKGALYLAERYSKLEAQELPADHWLMIAIEELDVLKPIYLLRQTVISLAESIVKSAALTYDRRMAFWGNKAGFCPAATRAEGLGAAVMIALKLQFYDKTFMFLERLEQAVNFCLSCQVDENKLGLFPNANCGIGGFTHSNEKPIIRIDYVQHGIGAINALLYARQKITNQFYREC